MTYFTDTSFLSWSRDNIFLDMLNLKTKIATKVTILNLVQQGNKINYEVIGRTSKDRKKGDRK